MKPFMAFLIISIFSTMGRSKGAGYLSQVTDLKRILMSWNRDRQSTNWKSSHYVTYIRCRVESSRVVLSHLIAVVKSGRVHDE